MPRAGAVEIRYSGRYVHTNPRVTPLVLDQCEIYLTRQKMRKQGVQATSAIKKTILASFGQGQKQGDFKLYGLYPVYTTIQPQQQSQLKGSLQHSTAFSEVADACQPRGCLVPGFATVLPLGSSFCKGSAPSRQRWCYRAWCYQVLRAVLLRGVVGLLFVGI